MKTGAQHPMISRLWAGGVYGALTQRSRQSREAVELATLERIDGLNYRYCWRLSGHTAGGRRGDLLLATYRARQGGTAHTKKPPENAARFKVGCRASDQDPRHDLRTTRQTTAFAVPSGPRRPSNKPQLAPLFHQLARPAMHTTTPIRLRFMSPPPAGAGS